jgi:hypothetical protein
MVTACTSASPSGDESSSSSGDTSTSTTSLDPTTTTTSFTTTSTTTSTDESSTGAVIDGYPCSVQVVTHGALYDPLLRGEAPGLFPSPVADALEDACGCHTLTSGDQNLEWPGLEAPGGTLFVDYADLANSVESTTLGAAIASEVRGARMPPGSCPKPPEIAEVLIPWFDQGMPDGATFVP